MRIFLSTFGTAGDVVPFTRLARGLLERGHAVTAHSWSMYRGLFPAGVDFVAAGHDVAPAELAASLEEALRLPSPWLQIRRVARIFYGLGDGDAAARAYYARCREAMAGHTLAVCNVLDHVGQAAAELAGIPWVGWASRPPPPPDADRALAQEDQALGELLSAVTGGRRAVRTFRARSPLLDLIAGSPALALPFPAEPTLTLTGSWLDRTPPAPLPAAVEDFLAAGPALLIGFGARPDVSGRTAALAAAAVRAGWRPIVHVLAASPATLPPQPDTLVVREPLPHAALLPRVAAVVFHGGSGTAHEVCRAGRPSLAMPHLGDQFYWANALAQRGLGPKPLTFQTLAPSVLEARLRELRDPRFAARAAAVAAVLDAEDGV
ncbi:MAG: hypothetical protein U1F43_39285, partial [Myxococcota bacterium]